MRIVYKVPIMAALATFGVHLALVAVVLVLCLRDPDPDIVILWSVFSYIDFPISRLIEIIRPSYNLGVALAFAVAGGFQWALIGGALVFFFKQVARRQ